MSLNSNINPGEAAVITYMATMFTVIDMNMVIGAFTALCGLGIQLYFKREQNKRDQEKHEWEKKNQNQ